MFFEYSVLGYGWRSNSIQSRGEGGGGGQGEGGADCSRISVEEGVQADCVADDQMKYMSERSGE